MIWALVGFQELIPLLVFAGLVAFLWSVLSGLSNRNSRAQERLERMSRPASLAELEDPKLKKERFQSVMETAKALSAPLMPQTELEQSALRLKLAHAGFRSDSAVAVYLGLRLVCLVGFLLLSCGIFLPKYGCSGASAKPIVAITGLGFYLPGMILWWLRRKRQQVIFLSLPDA